MPKVQRKGHSKDMKPIYTATDSNGMLPYIPARFVRIAFIIFCLCLICMAVTSCTKSRTPNIWETDGHTYVRPTEPDKLWDYNPGYRIVGIENKSQPDFIVYRCEAIRLNGTGRDTLKIYDKYLRFFRRD